MGSMGQRKYGTGERGPQGQIRGGRPTDALYETFDIAIKEAFLFNLVPTQKHWELGSDGVSREVSGPAEWRIDGTTDKIWLVRDAAIRYVTQRRDKTTDAAIKKNADQTLAKLQHLHY